MPSLRIVLKIDVRIFSAYENPRRQRTFGTKSPIFRNKLRISYKDKCRRIVIPNVNEVVNTLVHPESSPQATKKRKGNGNLHIIYLLIRLDKENNLQKKIHPVEHCN